MRNRAKALIIKIVLVLVTIGGVSLALWFTDDPPHRTTAAKFR